MSYTRNTVLTNITAIQPKSIGKPLKITAPASSIVKPLRVLKNSSGPKNEIKCSLQFHSKGIPLLVSPTLLRLRNLGQIDLARVTKDNEGWIVEIGEVKSSIIGVEQMQRGQKKRLFSSQHFLAGLLGHRTRLLSLRPE
jgi:hypothetical protein